MPEIKFSSYIGKALQQESGYLINPKAFKNLQLGVDEVIELHFLEIGWNKNLYVPCVLVILHRV